MSDDPNAVTRYEQPREIAVGTAPEQRLSMLREALTNPDVDPSKALAMAELIFRMEDRDLQAQFNRDKVLAIAEMPQISKRGHNTFTDTRYAHFEDIHRRVRPILDTHNLQISFDIGSDERGRISVTPILSHRNGVTERGSAMVGPPDEGKGRSAVQAVVSTSSYLKRATMKAMLNIIEGGASEDDDGHDGLTDYDRLPSDKRKLVDDGRTNANQGEEAYLAWFKALPPAEKGWLAFEPYHGQNREAAALADQS